MARRITLDVPEDVYEAWTRMPRHLRRLVAAIVSELVRGRAPVEVVERVVLADAPCLERLATYLAAIASALDRIDLRRARGLVAEAAQALALC